MRANWQRINWYMYRLDDVWTVQLDEKENLCRVYRGTQQCLGAFAGVRSAMQESERLRKEDEAYR